MLVSGVGGCLGLDGAAHDMLLTVGLVFVVAAFALTLASRIARTRIPGYAGGIFGVGSKQHSLMRLNQAMFVLWKPISKICLVQQDYATCHKMGNDLLEFLSFGKAEHLGGFAKPSEQILEDKEQWREFFEYHQEAAGELSDLVEIWNEAFQSSLSLSNNPREWEPVKRVAEALGVDIMVESYYDGIPIDALVGR